MKKALLSEEQLKNIFYDKVTYRFAQNEKILCGIIFAITIAFEPKAPLDAAFTNYHNELIYISMWWILEKVKKN